MDRALQRRAARRDGQPRFETIAAAGAAPGALAGPAQLQLLPLALAGAGADPAGHRRLAAPGDPDPAAAVRGAGLGRSVLPVRRAAVPGQGEAAVASASRALAALHASGPGRGRARGRDRCGLERIGCDRRQQAPGGRRRRRIDQAVRQGVGRYAGSRAPSRPPDHRSGRLGWSRHAISSPPASVPGSR